MSFQATEILIDILTAARPYRPGMPGFAACAEATRAGEGDEDELDCSEATRASGGDPAYRLAGDLAALRGQLREALAAGAA